MENSVSMITSVWKVEQGILDVFHGFCKDYNISYSLGYGTLLGAIRHNGFIPWDDDIDIIMLRSEYDKFITLWKEHPVEGYVLQCDYDKYDDDYPNNFCKLRKDHTAFIQGENEKKKKYHKGIFIDIFPMDRVAPQGIARNIQLYAFFLNMLYSRGYTDGSKGLSGIIQRFLLALPTKVRICLKKKAHAFMTRWNNINTLDLVVPCTAPFCHVYYPSDLMDKIVDHVFCGKQYCIIDKYDLFLKVMYGDYMVLPPEKERIWKHSPIYISVSENYEHF